MSSRSTRRYARRVGALAVVAALALTSGSAAGAPDDPDDRDRAECVLATGQQTAPKSTRAEPTGVDPYRGIVLDPAKVDYAAWAREARERSKVANAGATEVPTSRTAARQAAAANDAVFYQEREPAGRRGSNDRIANAERIAGVGTGPGDENHGFLLGRLSPEPAATPTTLTAKAEDNGSIPLAQATGVQGTRRAAKIAATVGDGPFGTTSGDFDAYTVTLRAGQELLASGVATGTGATLLDGYMGLYDAAGTLVDFDDDSGAGFDPLITYTAPAAGTFHVFMGGFRAGEKLPSDPNDSSSGPGVGDTGPYELTLSTRVVNVDFYRVDAEGGDVLGVNLDDNATFLGVYEGSGKLVHGTEQDASFLYPPNAPLPGGGNAVASHVVRSTGPIYFAVQDGDGIYTADVAVYRPGFEYQPVDTSPLIFLDFDGQRVNTAIWGGPGVRTLSPLSAFLALWGLSADDEDALIDEIVAVTKENVRRDLRAQGINPRFALRFSDSRTANPWGRDNVSRIIVGGTIDESGIPTIGIAQYIDPGNYGLEDSGLVLLDVLSDPAGDDASLNTYITEESDVIEFVGQAIGNITSHEIGHYIGSYHVDQFNENASLMDQGGNFPLLYGVGPDEVGGTDDDPDVDFNEDVFNPNEGFTGLEDTAVRSAWAHGRGGGIEAFPV